MTRLIQIKKGNVRRVPLVEAPKIHELAHVAIAAGNTETSCGVPSRIPDAFYRTPFAQTNQNRLL
jgi:hypothetical protein